MVLSLSLDLPISPIMSTQVVGGIKCTILQTDNGKDIVNLGTKGIKVSYGKNREFRQTEIIAQHGDIDWLAGFLVGPRKSKEIVGQAQQEQSCKRIMGSTTENGKAEKEGPNYMGQKEIYDENDYLDYLGLEGYAKKKKENRLPRMELLEWDQSPKQIVEEEMEHPPGFPKPKYKVSASPTPRRSKRISEKKSGAGKNEIKIKQPIAPKMKLNFEERVDPIEEELAIMLMKESGAVITEKVKEMIKEASSKEAGKGKALQLVAEVAQQSMTNGLSQGEEDTITNV